MRFSSTLLVASVIATAAATSLSSGQVRSINALNKIMGRQTRICKPVSVRSCALSCGDGYVTCVSWPTCYNPGRGDSCCSDGKYCPSGSYCTDGGCCPNGSSLAECGATVSLSIILPVVESTTTSTTSAVATSTTTTTTSAVVTTTSASSSTSSTTSSSSTISSSSASSSSSSAPTTTPRPTTTRAPSTGSTTSSTGPLFTGAAQSVGVGAAQMAIGGLAVFMML